jgi:hypothetical protein
VLWWIPKSNHYQKPGCQNRHTGSRGLKTLSQFRTQVASQVPTKSSFFLSFLRRHIVAHYSVSSFYFIHTADGGIFREIPAFSSKFNKNFNVPRARQHNVTVQNDRHCYILFGSPVFEALQYPQIVPAISLSLQIHSKNLF